MFEKKVKPVVPAGGGMFAKKNKPPPATVTKCPGAQVAPVNAAHYKDDIALPSKSKVTTTPPVMLKIIRVIECEDGMKFTLEYLIWDTLARVYLLEEKTMGHKFVAQFELGHDNRDFARRRKYLETLANIMPRMLRALADKSVEEGYK